MICLWNMGHPGEGSPAYDCRKIKLKATLRFKVLTANNFNALLKNQVNHQLTIHKGNNPIQDYTLGEVL